MVRSWCYNADFYNVLTGYVKDLMTELLHMCTTEGFIDAPCSIPDFLCSNFDRPNKKEAISQQQKRFNNHRIIVS